MLSPKLTSKSMNAQRTMDEMRQHIAKLKSDLESEKTRNKQLHRDKIAEIRNIKDNYNRDKEDALEAMASKLDHQKHLEMQRLKETWNKEKDLEIRQLIKSREEDIRQIKSQISEEKEDAIRVALEMQKRALTDPGGSNLSPHRPSSNSALVIKLQREIKQLKDTKRDLEDQVKVKTQSDNDKSAEIRKLQTEHDLELKKLMRESKQEVARGINQLKKAEDALHTKNKEVNAKDNLVDKLYQEKVVLGEQLKTAKSHHRDGGSTGSNASVTLELNSSHVDSVTDDVTEKTTESSDVTTEVSTAMPDVVSDGINSKCLKGMRAAACYVCFEMSRQIYMFK